MLYKHGPDGRADLDITVHTIVNQGNNGQQASSNVLFYYNSVSQDGYFFRLNTGAGNSGFYRMQMNQRAGFEIPGATYQGGYVPGTWYRIDIVVVNHEFFAYVTAGLAQTAAAPAASYEANELVSGSYSFNPSYSQFRPMNQVGFFGYQATIRIDAFSLLTDTLHETFPNGQMRHWSTVNGYAAPIGWAGGGASGIHMTNANAIYLGGGSRGFDGFVMDFDIVPVQNVGFLELYLQAAQPNPNPGGPPSASYLFTLPLDAASGPHQFYKDSRATANMIGWDNGQRWGTVLIQDFFDAATDYHVRIVGTVGRLYAYIEDSLVAYADATGYKFGGFQMNGRNLNAGTTVNIKNLIVSRTTVGDDFENGLGRWETTGGPEIVDSALELNANGASSGWLKQSTISSRAFEIRARVTHVSGVGQGAFLVFHKNPLDINSYASLFDLLLPPPGGAGGVIQFEECFPCQGVAAGAPTPRQPIGSNSNLAWPNDGAAHSIRVVVSTLETQTVMNAYFDDIWAATAQMDGPVAGRVGVMAHVQSVVKVDDYFVLLDSDGDGLLDTIERGGTAQETGVTTIPTLNQNSLSLDYKFDLAIVPQTTSLYAASIRVNYPKVFTFDVDVAFVGCPTPTTLSTTFTGSGRWSIYQLDGSFTCDQPGNYQVTVTFRNVWRPLLLDWVALRWVDTHGSGSDWQRTALSHVQDATDHATNAGVSDGFQSVPYFTEWEWQDFDGDQMVDERETRMQFRTDVPFGAREGKYFDGTMTGYWVEYRGWYYQFSSYQQFPAGQPSGTLLFAFADGTQFLLEGNVAPSSGSPHEQITVWHPGGLNSRANYTRVAPWVAQHSDGVLEAYAGWGELALQYQSETSNLRFAYIIGAQDDSCADQADTCHLTARTVRPLRDAFYQAGYADDSIILNQPCSGTGSDQFDASWLPSLDRLLVANGDASGSYYDYQHCFSDRPASSQNVSDGFAALGDVMDANDQLTVVVYQMPPLYYLECINENDPDYVPIYRGYDLDGTTPVISWSQPDIACAHDHSAWQRTPVEDFLRSDGLYLGKITKYSFIVTYALVPSSEKWFDIEKDLQQQGLFAPRSAIVGFTEDKDMPDALDTDSTVKEAQGACVTPPGDIPHENYNVDDPTTVTQQAEAVAYLIAGLTLHTFGDNDIAGNSSNDRYANSHHDVDATTSVYRAWLDLDNNRHPSYIEGLNYAEIHSSSCGSGTSSYSNEFPEVDHLRIDDDGLTGTGSDSSLESVGTGPALWRDGRNLENWYP